MRPYGRSMKPAAVKRAPRPVLEEVKKRAVCRRCGGNDSAWVQSYRTEKFYLALVVEERLDGTLLVDRRRFHECAKCERFATPEEKDAYKGARERARVHEEKRQEEQGAGRPAPVPEPEEGLTIYLDDAGVPRYAGSNRVAWPEGF